MKIESKTRKAILGFTTFFLLLTAFALYFFFFVQQRKENLSEKNFNILSQASKNIIAKVHTYDQNINNVSTLLTKSHIISQQISTAKRLKKVGINPTAISRLQLFNWLKSQGAINANLTAARPSPSDTIKDAVFLEEHHIAKKISVKDSGLVIRQDLKSFLEPLLWQDDFDDYLVLNHKSQLIFQKGNIGVYSVSLDSLLHKEGGNHSLKAGTEKITQIQGKDYKVFAYPFRISADQKFVLVGVRSAKAFNEQSMYISSLTVVSAATLFFVLLLSFPFLKILLISKNERLGRSDIVLCLVSLFTITALVSLLMLDMFQYRKYSEQHIQKNLKAVSTKVQSHFKQEMVQALNQLKHYDSLYAQGCNDENKVDLNTLAMAPCVKNADSSRQSLQPSYYNKFDFIFWIDENGHQTHKWTVKAQNTASIDVSKRKYFQKIRSGQGWQWLKRNIDLFFLESIYSFNTGKSYAALSLPSGDTNSSVVAMTAEFQSLFDPILTHGYRYALISGQGDVLFHSDKRRNLQENILHDITHPEEVTSAIQSRVFSAFKTRYHGKDYEACITPVEDWPIYLITFYDTGYFKSANAEILSVCIVMLGVYGILVFLMFIVILASATSPTKLHFSKTRLNWIVPHPQNSRLYQQSLIFTILQGVFFVITYLFISTGQHGVFSQLIVLVAFCAIYTVVSLYFILNKKATPRIFLKRQFPILLFSGAIIVFLNIATYKAHIPISKLLLFQGLSIISFTLLRILLKRWPTRFFPYPIDYKVAILSFVLIICLPPVFTFFKISHDTEFRLYTKLVQLDFAEKLNASGKLDDCIAHCKANEQPLYTHLSPILQIPATAAYDKELVTDSLFTHLYTRIRVMFSDKISETQHLNKPRVVGNNWNWQNTKQEVILKYNNREQNSALTVCSELSDYNLELEKPLNTLLVLALAALIIALLYLLISFIFRKTVMSKLLQRSRPVLMDMDVFGSVLTTKKPINQDLRNQNIFLIGLPNAGKTKFVHERLLARDTAYHKIDLTALRDHEVDDLWNITAQGASTIILDHFEFGMHDFDIIKKKLVLIENIITRGGIRMIAVSTVHPLNMIDSAALQRISGVEPLEAKIISERWVRVVGNFYKTFFTIAFSANIYRDELDDEDAIKLIENECRHGGFLKSIEAGLKAYASANPVSNDELILKIQSLATFYYYSLWKSCTAEEKYLLYDLAQDGLVNTRNVKVITSLVNKGLVHSMGTLVLLNRSFRNFILTTVNPDEALALEVAIKQTGAWSVIRIPLIVTLLALGVFIFYTQRDLLNNALALIATLAAALPMVLKVIGSLKGAEKSTD
jgi:hypothetical protein